MHRQAFRERCAPPDLVAEPTDERGGTFHGGRQADDSLRGFGHALLETLERRLIDLEAERHQEFRGSQMNRP